MSCDLCAKGRTVQIRPQVLFVPWLAMTLAAGYPASAAGQPIQMVLRGAIDPFGSPNPNLEQFDLQEGDPVRFIVEFDPESPTGKVDRLLIQLDGTTFTNSSNFEFGTFFGQESSPDTGFLFQLFSLDTFSGARNGIDFTLQPVSAVSDVFELRAGEVSTAAGFPVDLTFEDFIDMRSGIFGLGTAPPSGVAFDLFTVDFSDLHIHVIPEPTAAALILIALATVLWLRPYVTMRPAALIASSGERRS